MCVPMQGFDSGHIKMQSLAGVLFDNERDTLVQAHSAGVSCMMRYHCELYDKQGRRMSLSLLLSGSINGSFTSIVLPAGRPFLTIHLHTSKVRHNNCTLESLLFIHSVYLPYLKSQNDAKGYNRILPMGTRNAFDCDK